MIKKSLIIICLILFSGMLIACNNNKVNPDLEITPPNQEERINDAFMEVWERVDGTIPAVVTQDLELITFMELSDIPGLVNVRWQSSNSNVIASNGTIVRQPLSVIMNLTLEVSFRYFNTAVDNTASVTTDTRSAIFTIRVLGSRVNLTLHEITANMIMPINVMHNQQVTLPTLLPGHGLTANWVVANQNTTSVTATFNPARTNVTFRNPSSWWSESITLTLYVSHTSTIIASVDFRINVSPLT